MKISKNHFNHEAMLKDGFSLDGKTISVLNLSALLDDFKTNFHINQNNILKEVKKHITSRNPNNYFFNKFFYNSTESLLNVTQSENDFRRLIMTNIPNINNMVKVVNNNKEEYKIGSLNPDEAILIKKFVAISIARSPIFIAKHFKYLFKFEQFKNKNVDELINNNVNYLEFVNCLNLSFYGQCDQIYKGIYHEKHWLFKLNNQENKNVMGELNCFPINFDILPIHFNSQSELTDEWITVLRNIYFIPFSSKSCYFLIKDFTNIKEITISPEQIKDKLIELYNKNIFNYMKILLSNNNVAVANHSDDMCEHVINALRLRDYQVFICNFKEQDNFFSFADIKKIEDNIYRLKDLQIY